MVLAVGVASDDVIDVVVVAVAVVLSIGVVVTLVMVPTGIDVVNDVVIDGVAVVVVVVVLTVVVAVTLVRRSRSPASLVSSLEASWFLGIAVELRVWMVRVVQEAGYSNAQWRDAPAQHLSTPGAEGSRAQRK